MKWASAKPRFYLCACDARGPNYFSNNSNINPSLFPSFDTYSSNLIRTRRRPINYNETTSWRIIGCQKYALPQRNRMTASECKREMILSHFDPWKAGKAKISVKLWNSMPKIGTRVTTLIICHFWRIHSFCTCSRTSSCFDIISKVLNIRTT